MDASARSGTMSAFDIIQAASRVLDVMKQAKYPAAAYEITVATGAPDASAPPAGEQA